MDWTEDMIARIRDLWAEGHPTAEIGRRMGVTKNSIVGKAHRLALPPRPSPIRPITDGTARQRPKRPQIPRLTTFPARPAPVVASCRPTADLQLRTALGAIRAQRTAPSLPVRFGPKAECCWPIGEPGAREFRYCDAVSLAGRPYCEEHAQVAYVRPRDRREAAHA